MMKGNGSDRLPVVTGLGIVTALGRGTEATLSALKEGRTGIGKADIIRSTLNQTHLFGEIRLTDSGLSALCGMDPGMAPRTALLGMLAAQDALTMSGASGDNMAFLNGTTVGGMDRSEDYLRDRLTGDDTRIDLLLTHDCGNTTDLIAGAAGLGGERTTISTACSSGANAIGMAARMVRQGKAERVLAGGTDGLCRFTANGFNSLMILDREWCRPFSADRAGLNLGEGAAYLVIESLASAQNRRAEVWGVVSGYANSNDAFHQTASSPEGNGAYEAMRGALAMSGSSIGDVDHINAHGTATPNNDSSESAAINRLFGAEVPPVVSTKAYTGHTLAACGAIEAVFSLLCMKHGFIPAGLNIRQQMPENTWSPSTGVVHRPIRTVVSNSFGFGGNNTTLVFSTL